MTVLRTVGVAHPVTLIFMTPEIMKHGGNGITLRRPGMIGLLRPRSPCEGALLAISCFLSQSCRTCMDVQVAIAPWDVPAVSGTVVCATDGSDMVMVVLSPDSYDLIRMADHPFKSPPLDGALVMHPEDVSVLLDVTDTVLTRGIPGLPSPVVAVGRPAGILLTSAFGTDSPDFLDTGDPALCLPVP